MDRSDSLGADLSPRGPTSRNVGVFYFSGTGNTLLLARTFANAFTERGRARTLVDIARSLKKGEATAWNTKRPTALC